MWPKNSIIQKKRAENDICNLFNRRRVNIPNVYIKKNNKKTEEKGWDFSGDPVIGALCFHYRGYGFNPWSGNWDPTCFKVRPKKKNKQTKKTPEKDNLLQKWVSGLFIEK